MCTDELPTRFAVKFFVLRVVQDKKAKDFFYQRATYKGRKYKKPRKLLNPPGLVCCRKEKKRERPRKVVCRHKKGTWKKKKRKEKDQGRQEGGSTKARFRVSSTKKFHFLVHEYLGPERLISVEVSAPTRLSLQGSHVRRKVRKRTTLRSESSTLKGLLYAPIKQEQYHKGYSTQVEDPAANVARKAALLPRSKA